MKTHQYTIVIDRQYLSGSWYREMKECAEEYGDVARETRRRLTVEITDDALTLHTILGEIESWGAEILSIKEQ